MKKIILLFGLLGLFFSFSGFALDCSGREYEQNIYQKNRITNAIIQRQIDGGMKNNEQVAQKYKYVYEIVKKMTKEQKDKYGDLLNLLDFDKIIYSLENYKGHIVKAYTKNGKNYIDFDFYSYATNPKDMFCDLQTANVSKIARTYEVDTNFVFQPDSATAAGSPCSKILASISGNTFQEEYNYPVGFELYYKKRCGKVPFSELLKYGCSDNDIMPEPDFGKNVSNIYRSRQGSCLSNPKIGGEYTIKFKNGKVISLMEEYFE